MVPECYRIVSGQLIMELAKGDKAQSCISLSIDYWMFVNQTQVQANLRYLLL